jgi:hypothetical protein
MGIGYLGACIELVGGCVADSVDQGKKGPAISHNLFWFLIIDIGALSSSTASWSTLITRQDITTTLI